LATLTASVTASESSGTRFGLALFGQLVERLLGLDDLVAWLAPRRPGRLARDVLPSSISSRRIAMS
jgi:hypothetical protein